jgi:hypothetical protein
MIDPSRKATVAKVVGGAVGEDRPTVIQDKVLSFFKTRVVVLTAPVEQAIRVLDQIILSVA